MNETPRDPANAPAAWYPTDQPGTLRYWDGTQWTQHVCQTETPPPHHPQATQTPPRRKLVITAVIAATSIATIALVLALGSLSGWFRTGLGATHANCASEKSLNKLWDEMMFNAGSSGEKFTYKQVIVDGLPLEELKDSCAYSMSSSEGTFILLIAFDDIPREQINKAYLHKKWKLSDTSTDPSTDPDADPDADQKWTSETCHEPSHSSMSAEEITQIVQGNPELVGGFVEVFSKQMAELFPNASYAAAFTIPTQCEAQVTSQQR